MALGCCSGPILLHRPQFPLYFNVGKLLFGGKSGEVAGKCCCVGAVAP